MKQDFIGYIAEHARIEGAGLLYIELIVEQEHRKQDCYRTHRRACKNTGSRTGILYIVEQ